MPPPIVSSHGSVSEKNDRFCSLSKASGLGPDKYLGEAQSRLNATQPRLSRSAPTVDSHDRIVDMKMVQGRLPAIVGSTLSNQAESPAPRFVGKIAQLSASPFNTSSLNLDLAEFQSCFELTADESKRMMTPDTSTKVIVGSSLAKAPATEIMRS